MPIVKVKSKYQITIPTDLRKQFNIGVGDLLDAAIERGKITYSPKSIIDKRLAQSIAEVKAGRVYGPFHTVEEFFESLEKEGKKLRAKKSKRTAK